MRDFIERYFNLGIYRISRNEGMYPVVKDIINFQLGLAEVVRRLSITIQRIHESLVVVEQSSRI